MCSMLFVLGKPQKAQVSHDNNNVLYRTSLLSCSSISTTYPTNHTTSFTYNWKVNGVPNPANYTYSSSKQTLTVMSVSKEDANNRFKCSATETGDGITGYTSDYSNDFIFTVIYGPDSSTTKLVPTNTEYTLNEGVRLNDITCVGDCYPSCNFKWTKPGTNGAVTVSSNAVLSLGHLSRTEAATYTCEVTNPGNTGRIERKEVIINVNYGPDAGSLTLVPVKTTYTENEGMRLNDITCSAACYPACHYKWTNSRTNSVVSGSVLSLGILNKHMAATYTCTATNPRNRSTAVTNVVLHVRYGPDACSINVQSPLTLTEGETSSRISCQSDCYPSCSHTWTNMSSSSSVGGSGNFQLVKLTRYQAGYYQCLCKNTAVQYGKIQTSVLNVIIKYPPEVNVSLSTENITVGNSLTLACDANGVPSVYHYKGLLQTWNAVIIPNTNREVSGSPEHSTLHIPSLQLQDSGRYTCYVNNGVKTVDSTSSVNLKVRAFPKVLTPLLKFVGETGGIAKINVQFYSFPAVNEVVFQRYDNQTISSDSDKKYTVTIYETTVHDKFYGKDVTLNGMQANMIITNLKQEDFGTYTLILKNELGDIAKTLTINAESRPLPPKDFQILPDLSIPIFLWQKDFNGGSEQTFVIQTMLAGSQQWRSKLNINEKDTTYQINSTFYTANIDGLQPGIYIARIFSRNRKGDSEYVYIGTTFDVGEPVSSEGDKSSHAAPVAAGISSAIVFVVVVIGITAFLIWKKRKNKGQTDNGTYKDGQSGPSSQVQYEDLQGARETDPAQTYESLHGTYNELSAYASLTDKTDKPPTKFVNSSIGATGNDAVYENLKLKGMTAAYFKPQN